MGQRANLAIKKIQGYDLYYCHWCANSLPHDLFWGAAHTEEFIRAQRPVGHDKWLDTVWAEGGAVLDPLDQTLLFFGGGDILYEVPLRRLYLRLMQVV